ncbi:hypothetical protein KFK09_017788 [Dendrobium nobile]|uniref:Uncharacterized protein n=1 Tax=Dendrobium nobile TaxID=94219 RepID=A0A8T3AV31_DENNO|nr:hypothetical protein KFK09_017788 [Dendrobium nobile]
MFRHLIGSKQRSSLAGTVTFSLPVASSDLSWLDDFAPPTFLPAESEVTTI